MSIELKDKLVTLESLGAVYNSEVTARNAAIVEAINQAETGAPTKVELVSQMTDPDKNYLYIGEEQGYNSGHIYYLVDGAPVDKGVFGGTNIDNTLTISGQAADAKVTGDKIEEIKEDLSDLRAEVEGGGSGLTADLKAALDQLAQKVAYIDEDGQTYYDALHAALYPPVNLARISCVYTQSGTVYAGDALDSLRPDLVVTAHYNNGTTETIITYTLSGTLTEGTNTISVSYGGKTITFSVVAQKPEWGSDYTWLYKASDGVLLSQYDNVQTFKKGRGCTEEINDNVLHVVSPAKNAAEAVEYYFKPETNINGKLTAKMRFNELGVVPGGGGNVRMQIGNASGGARLAEKMDGQKYYITVRGETGEDYADLIEINLDTWYIVEVELHEGVQRLFCDGQLIGTKDVLNSYASSNALVVQAPLNSLATDVSIAWIAYKNGD